MQHNRQLIDIAVAAKRWREAQRCHSRPERLRPTYVGLRKQARISANSVLVPQDFHSAKRDTAVMEVKLIGAETGGQLIKQFVYLRQCARRLLNAQNMERGKPLNWCQQMAFMYKQQTSPMSDRIVHEGANEFFNGAFGEYRERPLMEQLAGRAV
ncbi:MAG: hypothetical protein QM740_19135 [Acidovorax sp.]